MAENGEYENHVDLVCEGGGIKGIGLAGAYSVLEERGFEAQNVAGTSAGAITAALIAARYSAEDLKEIIISLDFRQFQDEGWEDRLPIIDRTASILLDQGLYEGTRFYEMDPRAPRSQGHQHVRRPRQRGVGRRPEVPLTPAGDRIRRHRPPAPRAAA